MRYLFNAKNKNSGEIANLQNERAKFHSPYNQMKKAKKCKTYAFLAAFLSIFCVFSLFSGTASAKTVKAAEAHNTFKSLKYFELDKPLSVFKKDGAYYIIDNERAVIYKNDVYDAIDLITLGIENAKSAQKCGSFLLILADNGLFALNLSDFSAKSITQNALSFSVCEKMNDDSTVFAVFHKTGDKKISLYKVKNKSTFSFDVIEKGYIEMNGDAKALALLPDYSFYYAKENTIEKLSSNILQKIVENVKAEQMQYSEQKLYFKASDGNVYCVNKNETKANVALSSSDLPADWKGFFVEGDYAYVCDYLNDKIIEYEISSKKQTGFEISFTKINLPQNFTITEAPSPLKTITISADQELYAIDLNESLSSGYFCYKGYHNQETSRDYLIVSEIESKYYLISGDCLALIEKTSNQTVRSPEKAILAKSAYLACDASALKYPVHDALANYSDDSCAKNFEAFSVKQNEQVQITDAVKFGDYEYALVIKDGKKGYIPAALLTESIYVAPEKTEFFTAKIYHKTTELFSDDKLTQKIGELNAYSSVSVYGETDSAYYVKTENGTKGYVAKSCVQDPSYYTIRTSIILIIAGISFLTTALFLENKYLYSHKKRK